MNRELSSRSNRLLRSPLLWTVVGAIAGVLGAIAALYPLLVGHQMLVQIEMEPFKLLVRENGEIQSPGTFLDGLTTVSIQPLSGAIVLTGSARLTNLTLTQPILESLERDDPFTVDLSDEANLAIPSGEKRHILVSARPNGAKVRADTLHCFQPCPISVAEATLEVEFKARDGTARTSGPARICLLRSSGMRWTGRC
jgi:hypothetical protein